MGDSLLFSKSNELWKQKRKAVAHAFYKDKLGPLISVFQDKVMDAIKQWTKEIEQSKEQATEIDISEEITKIYGKHIITISLGEDITDQQLELMIEKEGSMDVFELKKVNIITALKKVTTQLANNFTKKLVSHPVNLLISWTNKLYSFR